MSRDEHSQPIAQVAPTVDGGKLYICEECGGTFETPENEEKTPTRCPFGDEHDE